MLPKLSRKVEIRTTPSEKTLDPFRVKGFPLVSLVQAVDNKQIDCSEPWTNTCGW